MNRTRKEQRTRENSATKLPPSIRFVSLSSALFRYLKGTSKNLLRRQSAALGSARNLAYLADMSRLLCAGRLASCLLITIFRGALNRLFIRLFLRFVAMAGKWGYRLHGHPGKAAETSNSDLSTPGLATLRVLASRDSGTYSQGTILRFHSDGADDTINFFSIFGIDDKVGDGRSQVALLLDRYFHAYAAMIALEGSRIADADSSIFVTRSRENPLNDSVIVIEPLDERHAGRWCFDPERVNILGSDGRNEAKFPVSLPRRFFNLYNELVRSWPKLDHAPFRNILERRISRTFADNERDLAMQLYCCPKIVFLDQQQRSLPAIDQPILSGTKTLGCSFAGLQVFVIRRFSDGLWLELRETGHDSGGIDLLRRLTLIHGIAAGLIDPETYPVKQIVRSLPEPRKRIRISNLFHCLLARLIPSQLADFDRNICYRRILTRKDYDSDRWKERKPVSFSGAYASSVAATGGYRTVDLPFVLTNDKQGSGNFPLDLYKIDIRDNLFAFNERVDRVVADPTRVVRLAERITADLKASLAGANPIRNELYFITFIDRSGYLTHLLETLFSWNTPLCAAVLSDFVFSNTYTIKDKLVFSFAGKVLDLYPLLYGPEGGVFNSLGKRVQPLFDTSRVAMSKNEHTRLALGIAPAIVSKDNALNGGCTVSYSVPRSVFKEKNRGEIPQTKVKPEDCYWDFFADELAVIDPDEISILIRKAEYELITGPKAILDGLSEQPFPVTDCHKEQDGNGKKGEPTP